MSNAGGIMRWGIPRGGGAPIYGVAWDKSATPTLTRTDDAVGMVANIGVDDGVVVNDFDNADIYGEMADVEDAAGNVFVRIPRFYIEKTDGASYKTWRISRRRFSDGCYLPMCFWDFDNERELDAVYVGKFLGSLSDDDKLQSVADTYPLINKNIVEFRTYAQANGMDHQLLDIHAADMVKVMLITEFATLNSQDVMAGFTAGQYSAAHVATVAENDANRIVVANATANQFRVGQPISVGSSLGNNSVFYGRMITDIVVYDASNQSIEFDGDPVDIAIDDVVYNTGWKNGWSSAVAAASGCINDASNGLWPMMYRGLENIYGHVWQPIDGLNINARQGWVCEDARDYESNLFASPYQELSYANGDTSGYLTETGYDADFPFAALPAAVGGGSSSYFGDYYYQATGQRIALLGGYWRGGSSAGLSSWRLAGSSSYANVNLSARLVRKAL